MKKLFTALALTVALSGVTPLAAAEHRGMDQQRMDNMMDRAQEGDASDRQRLMREHMGLMMQNMHEMSKMMGPGNHPENNDAMPQGERLSMMEKRMQMMQQMMNQMLRHQQMMLRSTDDEEERE